jgi:N utilization substance protein B
MDQRVQALEINTVPVDAELPKSVLVNHDSSSNAMHRGLSRRDERVLAFHLLYAVEQHEYEDSIESVAEMLRVFDIEVPKDSRCLLLARGAIEKREDLDKLMLPFLKNWRLERLGCCTRLILRLALYEFSLPDSISNVIINEAIELAKEFAEKDSYRFINGILDEYSKAQQK